jgi:hypothetical protein
MAQTSIDKVGTKTFTKKIIIIKTRAKLLIENLFRYLCPSAA